MDGNQKKRENQALRALPTPGCKVSVSAFAGSQRSTAGIGTLAAGTALPSPRAPLGVGAMEVLSALLLHASPCGNRSRSRSAFHPALVGSACRWGIRPLRCTLDSTARYRGCRARCTVSGTLSYFIGLAVSAVEVFVPDVGKTLPGSCAAVWGLQPERGDPWRRRGDCPHICGCCPPEQVGQQDSARAKRHQVLYG